MKLLRALAGVAFAAQAAALAIGGKQMLVDRESNGLQSIVSQAHRWPSILIGFVAMLMVRKGYMG
jgi:hypothetical protein